MKLIEKMIPAVSQFSVGK